MNQDNSRSQNGVHSGKDLLHKAAQEQGVPALRMLIAWLRPSTPGDIAHVSRQVDLLGEALEAFPLLTETVRGNLCTFMCGLRFLPLYSESGILPRRGFTQELTRRLYNRIFPEPPIVFSAKDLLALVFDHPSDRLWVRRVPDEVWMRLYALLVPGDSVCGIRAHLLSEALYALEMLSVWIAAEEMESELLRLEPAIAGIDSSFIAQQREIAKFIQAYRHALNQGRSWTASDISRAWVLLDQTEAQVDHFRELAVTKGSSFRLTYLLERIDQTLERVRELLYILSEKNPEQVHTHGLSLFKNLVRARFANCAIGDLLRQAGHLVAKSVTTNAGKTGEHYVTENRREYFDMVRKALGAGIFIAIMALIKIQLTSLGLSPGWTTFWVCLNYGLGFVLIHCLHFTVATKQPAMTAAYIAHVLTPGEHGRANSTSTAKLLVQVGRSQFAAVLGNVAAALPVAVLLAVVASAFGLEPVSESKAAYLLRELRPFSGLALFHAATAGFWLFLSGLIAGYFDNRAVYLGLPQRIRRHPWLQRTLSEENRSKLADILGANYGALAGNFFFGILLGLTGYIGDLSGLPLDIRHVAFSVANLGYAVVSEFPGFLDFLRFFGFVLLIGGVNLCVSFALALNVALRSKGVKLEGPGQLLRAYGRELLRDPRAVLLPPRKNTERPASVPHR